MKQNMQQIKNRWLLLFDLLMFKVCYVKHFFDIVNMADTTPPTLKTELSDALTRYNNLNIKDMRGQGYMMVLVICVVLLMVCRLCF